MRNISSTTVTIHVPEEDFPNFAASDSMLPSHSSEEAIQSHLERLPYKAFTRQRDNTIAVNVSLERFVLLKAFGIIE